MHGSNNALVHPRGAVGIVTRTPCGNEQHFLVRFPDGFEASLLLDDLEVLTHFKDRLDMTGAGSFDLDKHVIYRCIVGSRAYGLETEACAPSCNQPTMPAHSARYPKNPPARL